MNITAVIAEYNPFHNGHKYHLDAARAFTHADYIIVVMSGDYTQRGLPAVTGKYARARMALENGADLVLELPLPFAVGSAEYFAQGAVSLLDKLGIVGKLCFGSEWGRVSELEAAARLLQQESNEYSCFLRERMKQGHSFPSARSHALAALSPEAPDMGEILTSPNNILGVEYIKAILNQNSSLLPVTIPRAGAGYHEEQLTEGFASAAAIRRILFGGSLADIRPHVPDNVYGLLQADWEHSFPVCAEDFSLLLHYKLLSQDAESLQQYMDVSPALADKIYKHLKDYSTFPAFCSLLKSKDLTHTRISRSLLHILLDIRLGDMEEYKTNGWTPYARILGFNRDAAPLLSAVKQHSSIPLISKLADAHKLLSGSAMSMLEKEITASHIYEAVISHKFHIGFRNEYTRKMLVL